jgi:hypothetical protein
MVARELRREADRWRVVDAKQPGECPAGRVFGDVQHERLSVAEQS